MLTHVPVTGNVDDNGGCNACLSPAPIEKRTCGPPGEGIYVSNSNEEILLRYNCSFFLT